MAFSWRDVLFSNWPVEPEVVTGHLPRQLTVQTFDGQAWLSVIPFRNVDTRPRGLPRLLGMKIPELNFRTYVTCDGEPGVYFFSLDADSLLAVAGARLLHRLPYYRAKMAVNHDGDRVTVTSQRRHPGARPVTVRATYEPTGEYYTAEEGTLASFLTERRRLYTQSASGRIRYTDVSHEPWTLSLVSVQLRVQSLFEANGFDQPAGEGVHYYSPGVSVVTDWNRSWPSA